MRVSFEEAQERSQFVKEADEKFNMFKKDCQISYKEALDRQV